MISHHSEFPAFIEHSLTELILIFSSSDIRLHKLLCTERSLHIVWFGWICWWCKQERRTGIKYIYIYTYFNKRQKQLQIAAPFHCQHVYQHMLEDPNFRSGSLRATASLQSSCYQEAWAAHWTWESLLWSNLVVEHHPAPQKLRCHKHGNLVGYKAVCNTSKSPDNSEVSSTGTISVFKGYKL